MKRRRLQYGTGILFVSFLVVTICFGTILHLVDQMDKNRIMDNALYSRNQREFAIVSTENEDLWQEVIPRISKEWNGVMVKKYHRNFSSLINGLVNSGFKIDEILEPIPDEEAIKIIPKYINQYDRPYFLFIRAKK